MGPPGPHAPWQELSRTTVYEKYGRSVVEVRYRLPSGSVDTFSVREDRPSVAVLALTPAGEILLTRQFRPGPGQFVYELPGGYVGNEESPLDAAERELLEETGYHGDTAVVGHCFGDSYSSSVKFCAIARNCTLRQPPQPDDTEFIEVLSVRPQQLRGLLRAGDVTDVDLAYLGLDALGLL
ncbi:ADP-ribose pyrophosphatase [Streptomyces africanus]|uniref:ADP-ribose pyrophosphatase n=1 Tax=Streptomyces africanus TaxID=231024 RepID=A0ABU0QND4_9ACTN|nr:ADP-ribose pyrophosphatase [Streptomyces africanus]